MEPRKMLKQVVRKARRSLNMERIVPKFQYGLLLGLAFSAAILLVSRLFVLPYYRNVTVLVGLGVFVTVGIYTWWKRVREKEAMHQLDGYYPHNELVTALSLKDDENPLVKSLLQKAQKETPLAFEQFKKRKKQLWLPKALIGMVLSCLVIGFLSIFPSATQDEALVIEKEQEVIKNLEKEVAKLEKKTESKEIKKELQQLQNKLKEMETSEEALREVVKKQKELKLQEQKLKEKEASKKDSGEGSEGLTADEQKQLKELMELQNGLASTANSTQSSLSKLGKPISFDLQNAIASEVGSESDVSSDSDGSSSENESDGNQSGDSSQQGNGQNSNQGNNGQGNGNGSSSGSGQGQGNGSSGQGAGGQGFGSGRGSSGQGRGSGAGLGQGSRDLLAIPIPERISGGNGRTADEGPLGEGTAAGEQKGSVPMTKGTIRPYEEVIGQYKDSYLKSSERMQLPKDLQDIVQSYFSSIESNE